MSNVLLKSAIIFTLIVASIFAASIHQSYAAPSFVTVTANTDNGKTVLSITNSPSNTADIVSFSLQINGDGVFRSYKVDGWNEIKTNQQAPVRTWKSSDANGQDRETGHIGVQSENNQGSTQTQQQTGNQGENNQGSTQTQQQTQTTTQPPPPSNGILDSSVRSEERR